MLRFRAWNAFHAANRNILLHGSEPAAGVAFATGQQHKVRNSKARQAYIEAEVASGLAHQIRALRTQRGWTQKDLADKLGTTQAAVSRLEDPSYGRPSIKTLLDVGAAFDVALQVRFVSFVRLLQETRSVSREQLEVEPFELEAERVRFRDDTAPAPGKE